MAGLLSILGNSAQCSDVSLHVNEDTGYNKLSKPVRSLRKSGFSFPCWQKNGVMFMRDGFGSLQLWFGSVPAICAFILHTGNGS